MTRVLAALYRAFGRMLMFRFDAERAHGMVSGLLAMLHRSKALRRLTGAPPELRVEALGRSWRSPVGVAAGFDKHAEVYDGLGALGFAFVEVGTITAEAQAGNPRPRIFRLPADEALINRMGSPNPGAVEVARRIRAHGPAEVVVGVNLGKTKVVPNEEAAADYAASARALGPVADFVVVSVSSPNTPGVRALQAPESLRAILRAVQAELAAVERRVPLLVKIAPDLSDESIDGVAEVATELGLDGIVAINTTVGREGLRTPREVVEGMGEGGLSGRPVRERGLAVLRRLRRRAPGLTLVAVGGIFDAEDAWAAIRAGASLVEVYTGLVYRGPAIAREIVEGLRARMARAGVGSLAEVVGVDAGGE